MTATKGLGVYMDHYSARLIEYSPEGKEVRTITSSFTHKVKKSSIYKSEQLMHNKEQHSQRKYYNRIGDAIRNYDHVLLFGPTTAKTELFNLLKSDSNFSNIYISLKESDKINENQQHIFVRDYFISYI